MVNQAEVTKDKAREAAWDKKRCTGCEVCMFEGDGSCDDWHRTLHHSAFDDGYDFANQWNVIERDGLPDQDGEYRVTCAGERVSGKPFRFVMDADFKDGEWELITDVVAWRPLPEPYKESKK